jgi:hypothetical protein
MKDKTEFVSSFEARIIDAKNIEISDYAVQIDTIVSNQRIGRIDSAHRFRDGIDRRDKFFDRLLAVKNGICASDYAASGIRGDVREIKLAGQIASDPDLSIQSDFISWSNTSLVNLNCDARFAGTERTVRDMQVGAQLPLCSFVGQFDGFFCSVSGVFSSDGGLLDGVVRFVQNSGLPKDSYRSEHDKNQRGDFDYLLYGILAAFFFTVGIGLLYQSVFKNADSLGRGILFCCLLGLYSSSAFRFSWSVSLDGIIP